MAGCSIHTPFGLDKADTGEHSVAWLVHLPCLVNVIESAKDWSSFSRFVSFPPLDHKMTVSRKEHYSLYSPLSFKAGLVFSNNVHDSELVYTMCGTFMGVVISLDSAS